MSKQPLSFLGANNLVARFECHVADSYMSQTRFDTQSTTVLCAESERIESCAVTAQQQNNERTTSECMIHIRIGKANNTHSHVIES